MKRATVTKVSKQEAEALLNSTDICTWKNTGGGSFRIKRRIIKPGEVFEASQKDISRNFRDVIKPVGGTPIAKKQEPIIGKKQEPIIGKKPTFKVTPRETGNTGSFKVVPREGKADEKDSYNVVSVITTEVDGKKVEKEKVLNTKGLTKAKADKLFKALSE